jgi:hypothetical protein
MLLRSEEIVGLLAKPERARGKTRRVNGALAVALTLAAQACVGDDAPADPFDTSNGRAGTGGSKQAGSGGASGHAGNPATDDDAGTQTQFAAGSKQSHFPMSDGASWSYHHENPTKPPWEEDATMSATTYQGKPAFILMDMEDAQGEQTSSTMVVDGSGVFRAYKEVAVAGMIAVEVTYDPGFLRFDEGWTQGESVTLMDDWVQHCEFSSSAAKCAPGATMPGSTTHTYTLMSTSTSITVPAGTFDTVEVQRINPDANETKLFWFAAGVGKVREEDTGSGATEELTQYSVP